MIQFPKIFILLLTAALTASAPFSFAGAEDRMPMLSDRLSSLIAKALEEKIPHAEIKIPSLDKAVLGSALIEYGEIKGIRLVEDRPNGVVLVEVVGMQNEKEVSQMLQTPYEAWVKVPVPIHRIYPNAKLKNEDFRIQAFNVATGTPREFRGVMAAADTQFDKMESRQTILEGQFVVTSALQHQPDVRKGEMIRLELLSGDLSLTTQAVAQESASAGERIRVLTVKTKKEIVGKVKEDHSVEVSL